MRDAKQLIVSSVFEHFCIRAFMQPHVACAKELDGWLTTPNAMHDVLVQVMVSKKSWAAHDAPDTSEALSARKRLTTGLDRVSASACKVFQRASWRCR